MRGFGGERVIRSLLHFPRLTARGVISILPYKIKQEIDDDLYRDYIARCARILTENTARLSGGNYIRAEYGDMTNPKPRDNRTAQEIADDIISRAGIEVI